MKIAVVIPTYNEKENIEEALGKVFGLNIEGLEVIVVDDNSPDGTGRIVEKIKENNSKLHIIQRNKKMGLGTAYLEGFKHALDNGAEHIFEIDADFSHDFSAIPDFLESIKEFDAVVGSRYINQGKIENWNFSRRFFSKFGNIYAQFILNIPIQDLTTGYKCYRRKVVEYLCSKNIDSVGYVFQIETTYHAHKNGFKIKEIPITFTERRLGSSKFDFRIIWESLSKVLKLRLKK